MTYPDFFPTPITNPAELALSRAHDVVSGPDDIITPEEEAILIELDAISTTSGFGGSYFVEAGQAFAVPVSFPSDKPVSLIHFEEGLTFEGTLSTYSVFKIGRLAVYGEADKKIKALCLAFGRATLLPFFEKLDADKILYVPAYAIDDIQAS